jgi:predicted nucleic-acid-binding Zn-ribbon protein
MNKAKPSEKCVKCDSGTYNVFEYVRSAAEGGPGRASCFDCPREEHLHMSCDRCGYTVRGDVAAAPVPPPPSVVTPAAPKK